MGAKGSPRRVRPLLLILLWVWALCVAIVLDMFWNVEEFDRVRPRSTLYRGMRVAGHKLVGVTVIEEAYHHAARRVRLLTGAARSEDVEAKLALCRSAELPDVPALRELALTATEPLVAASAVGALGRLGEVAHDAELVALLSDQRPRVRQETIVALGKSRQPACVVSLEPLLSDTDPAVRLLAVRAIGEVGGPRAIELLRGVLERPGHTEAERECARAALP
jgi:HEAT repeat protein